jgi:hypothetical protein
MFSMTPPKSILAISISPHYFPQNLNRQTKASPLRKTRLYHTLLIFWRKRILTFRP